MMYTEIRFMKTFCEFLRDNIMKIINFKEKKVKILTKEQQKSYENPKNCYIAKKNLEQKNILKDKKYCKVRDHCYYIGEYTGAEHIICNLKNSVPKIYL